MSHSYSQTIGIIEFWYFPIIIYPIEIFCVDICVEHTVLATMKDTS